MQTIAHPAAIAIALLLTHLQKAGAIRRSVIEIFEPVSERGKAGIDELQKQTVALLSFKPLPERGLRRAGQLQHAVAIRLRGAAFARRDRAED